jgi:hypothetical protein
MARERQKRIIQRKNQKRDGEALKGKETTDWYICIC